MPCAKNKGRAVADNKAELTIDGNIAPLKQKLREAGDELKRFGASGGPAVDGVASSVMKLTTRFTALGAVLSLGGIASMARQSIDAADSLNDLADRTQTSVKALASFELIAKQSDTNLEALGKGLNKLSIFMAENAAEAKKLGITARDPVQAFIQFADALGRAATPQDRAAIANRVLGKSFQDLLPLLQRGAADLREAAAASEEYATKLEKLAPRAGEFNDRLDEMRLRWDALKVSMGSAFLDLLPNSMTMDKASARIIELKGNIGTLERALKGSDGSGLLHKMLYGTKDEITAKLAAARSELAALQAQKSAAPGGSAAGSGGPLTFGEVFDSGKKAKKAKTGDQVSDAEWAMEEAAHLQRTLYEIDQQRNEYHEAANQAVLEADKKLIKEMDQIQLLRVEGAKNAEIARIDEMEAMAAHELEMGSITQAEYLDRLSEFNQQRLAAEADLIEKKIELAKQDPTQDPVEIERLEQQLLELRRQYGLKKKEIDLKQAEETASIWRDLGDRVSGLWDKGVQALMNGTLTWKNAMQAVGAEVVRWFADKVVNGMVKDWALGLAKRLAALMGFTTAEKGVQVAGAAATVATKTAETTAVVAGNAAQAGSGAAASQASIPYVGPILALAAMAAVFAAVMAIGKRKSAAGGYDIPRGLNPVVQTHEEEMILPKKYANAIRDMTRGGSGAAPGGGNVYIDVHAQDADSFRYSQSQIQADMGLAYERMVKRNT
ncbi:MAG: hypothetical protein BGO62_10405 [Thiobacillus sp. 65-1402]|nr:MAG: hypothetical protein BGO62_10405 [Thiobacillus sp. 65-1402]